MYHVYSVWVICSMCLSRPVDSSHGFFYKKRDARPKTELKTHPLLRLFLSVHGTTLFQPTGSRFSVLAHAPPVSSTVSCPRCVCNSCTCWKYSTVQCRCLFPFDSNSIFLDLQISSVGHVQSLLVVVSILAPSQVNVLARSQESASTLPSSAMRSPQSHLRSDAHIAPGWSGTFCKHVHVSEVHDAIRFFFGGGVDNVNGLVAAV